MRVIEIPSPDLNISIRYRILSREETDILVAEYEGEKHQVFSHAVLDTVVFNMKEVATSLRSLSREKASLALESIFNGCLMLNPGLDVTSWIQISNAPSMVGTAPLPKKPAMRKVRVKKISKVKFLNLERHLKDLVVGQDEAIDALINALKRSQAGLGDDQSPLGVFLFAGSSGVGKTHIARELHKYLYPEAEMVRVDCGEYQHKHENQKLLGAPPGYLGHDEGGQLANAMLKNPATVVLIDEIEKAHKDIMNTFLRVFDEGFMTDGSGKKVPFADAIIIMTTNLGNEKIVDEMMGGGVGFAPRAADQKPPRDRVEKVAKEAIRKNFTPEFLNRIDKIVVFNHLTEEDNRKIAELELERVRTKLEKRGFNLTFDEAVLDAVVRDGISHVQGARGLAQFRRDRIENPLADALLNGRNPRGTVFRLSYDASGYRVNASRPTKINAT